MYIHTYHIYIHTSIHYIHNLGCPRVRNALLKPRQMPT